MKPECQLKIIASPKKWRGVFSNIHICQDKSGAQFLFKEADELVIRNELIAHRLAKLADIRVLEYLEPVTIDNRKGLIMSYLKDSVLLANFKQTLSSEMLRALQKIVLFDLWIGNRDRHAANIFVHGKALIAFDHGKILQRQKAPAIKFIKLNLGLRLDPQYLEKLEKQASPMPTGDVLLRWFGFKLADLEKIRQISDEQIVSALKGLDGSVLNYLRFRRDRFTKILFC